MLRHTTRWTSAVLVLVAVAMAAEAAWAVPYGVRKRTWADRHAYREARQQSWHGAYYYTQWGTPVSLVIPPNAHMQTKWGWGVGSEHMVPNYHQFARPFPGYVPGAGSSPFLPTPPWPSHTDQFGVYYVRGPW